MRAVERLPSLSFILRVVRTPFEAGNGPLVLAVALMVGEALTLPVESIADFEKLLAGGFDVVSMGEPWSAENITWQAFMCHKQGGLVSVSISMLHDRSESPFVAISPMRKLFWAFIRPRDRKLVREVTSYLIRNGGTRPVPSTHETV
jgi:hypothetical protein